MDKKEKEELENQAFIESLEKHIEVVKEAKRYSVQRFDIIMITLASSGILLSLKIWQDVSDISCHYELWPIVLALVLYVLTIFSNLVSQIAAYFANKTEIARSEHQRDSWKYEKVKEDKELQKKRKEKVKRLDKILMRMNLISLISLLIGILLAVYFAALNF